MRTDDVISIKRWWVYTKIDNKYYEILKASAGLEVNLNGTEIIEAAIDYREYWRWT